MIVSELDFGVMTLGLVDYMQNAWASPQLRVLSGRVIGVLGFSGGLSRGLSFYKITRNPTQ
jgi:hypothetical protein